MQYTRSNMLKRCNMHCRLKFLDFESRAVPSTSPFNCRTMFNHVKFIQILHATNEHNTPESYKCFPTRQGVLERKLFSINCIQGAEMSAAHKAFWLPLSQQSETANDLRLICVHVWTIKTKNTEGIRKVMFGLCKVRRQRF